MKTWNYTCAKFKPIRDLINDTEEEIVPREASLRLLTLLQECIKDIAKNYFKESTMYSYWIEEIQDTITDSDDEDEEIVQEWTNQHLGEFYEFCDDVGIWLPLQARKVKKSMVVS